MLTKRRHGDCKFIKERKKRQEKTKSNETKSRTFNKIVKRPVQQGGREVKRA